jgi:AMMECR1 domain-containing protein
LSELTPVSVRSEEELLRQLQPGVDGLVLRLGHAQATFLPAVWQQLSSPAEFLGHLKLKAGWRRDFWSPDIQVLQYTTESFGERP